MLLPGLYGLLSARYLHVCNRLYHSTHETGFLLLGSKTQVSLELIHWVESTPLDQGRRKT